MMWKCKDCGKESEGTRDELVEEGWRHLTIGNDSGEVTHTVGKPNKDSPSLSVSWCPECGTSKKVADAFRNYIVADKV